MICPAVVRRSLWMRQTEPESSEARDGVIARPEPAILPPMDLVDATGRRVDDDQYVTCGSPREAVRVAESEVLCVDDPIHVVIPGTEVAVASCREPVDGIGVVVRDVQGFRLRIPRDAHGVVRGLRERASGTKMTLQPCDEEIATMPDT